VELTKKKRLTMARFNLGVDNGLILLLLLFRGKKVISLAAN
jgi:hypothetical protein